MNMKKTDWILAGLFTAAGALLMVENITASADESLAHPLSTTSWAMLPVFLLAMVPILWRRRNILAVVGVTVAVMAVHLVSFEWVTRCGAGLPLAFALSYAVARFAGNIRNQAIGLAGVVVLILLVLAQDSSIGGLPGGLEIALPGAALFYGIGFWVQNRVTSKKVAERVAV
ncbi:hypothetical protein JIG36_03775 [Actinoplanes sp. LDG1-06]|uniref:Uncharacterized protein n=1 Tax=Paractinoplanes ovalisporus TaxID=2810368 RepID=A0ABS2A4A8_9ACTN|nr:hypothetical protein [Actinoplanes ovalisporus]MBM2614673.1 hypothetical protein [Actinoplanes ovalisporus]